MAGTEPKMDRELLGRVAALTPGQQRWLRAVLQSVFTMEPAAKRPADEERRRTAGPRPAVREPGHERRRFGEAIMRLFERPDEDDEEDGEDKGDKGDEGARLN